MDLHRDGTQFGLSPFEVEMRRRLWWKLRSLQHRCAEENGMSPPRLSFPADTKLPLCINDMDIDPETAEFPMPRTGCTSMTIVLMAFEITAAVSSISLTPTPTTHDDFEHQSWIEQKERQIEGCHNRLNSRYLQYCDSSRPLDRMTMIYTKLAIVSDTRHGRIIG